MAPLPPLLRAILATAAMLAAACAQAAIYKSVDREGRVIFSDIPPQDAVAVLRIASSDDERPPAGEQAIPRAGTLADDLDEAVLRANARVDAAEHALALARQALAGEPEGMTLVSISAPGSRRAQIEFFKRDVLAARRDLLSTLKRRRAQMEAPRTYVAGG